MPEFSLSLPGVFCAGNAGDGGVVSTNDGKVVLGPNAGNAHFLNGVEFVCQSYGPHPPKLVAVNVLTGASRDLLLDGVNKIVAGADHWFAVTMHNGVLLDGRPVTFSVRAFAGPYMAWFPWDGTGLIHRGPDGDVTLSTTLGPEDPIQLFPDGGVVWAEGGKVHSYGIPDFPAAPVVLDGGFGWVKAFRVGSVWWLAYQSYALESVVAHPATELIGYLWPAPKAFRLDATMIAGRPRLIWSRSDADAPADIELRDIDLSAPRVDLASSGQPVRPKIAVLSYDHVFQSGETWASQVRVNDLTITVRKDATDNLYFDAENAAGSDHTGLVRHLTIVGPKEPEPPMKATRFWCQPNIGSTDLLDLFDDMTRLDGVEVFVLYSQHLTQDQPNAQWGQNTYPNFVARDAFRKLEAAGIPLAMEGGFSEGDLVAIDRVAAEGGRLHYVSVSEPLTYAKQHGQSVDVIADTVASYTTQAKDRGATHVGWLEAWPEIPYVAMESYLSKLKARETLPDYWHLDIDWNRAAHEHQDPAKFIAQCTHLAFFYGIPLGVFINSTIDPITPDAAHHDNLIALAKRVAAIDPDLAQVHVASWALRTKNGTQDVPQNLGPVGMLQTYHEIKPLFHQLPEPEPPPALEGDPMFATLIDPTKETLAVKDVKPTGDPGMFTLVLADYTTVEQGKSVLHVGEVFSCQPDGSAGTRPSGTAGAYERCTVNGNVATYKPIDKYFTRHFVKVTGL
jgi:hypothetical protein